ncbi:MAG: phytanoyl-CoA dioxygenase family protein [Anaerolineae bacterium]|nr:phytanoyl-CoA dioxygenase family protein [Anaerolineae bacterium]
MVAQQVEPQVYTPYRVSVEQYVTFREQGFLVVPGLIPPEDIQRFNTHVDNLLAGRETIPGIVSPPIDLPPEEKLKHWQRAHMLHRVLPLHEFFLLHPRTLDVLEALIGPDVLALQSMLFFKQPGQIGQGYHQDSYYIPTQPDTLCGAWVALDPATEENGCLWMTVGSQHEPIYPDDDGASPNGDRILGDIQPIRNASNTDETLNALTPVARKYAGREVSAEVQPGDVIFFGGHIIHRSHSNRSKTQSRRSFVGHYCNARSFVPWNHGMPYEGDSANDQHILARGSTHLPYAQPRFGTPCAANQPERYGARPAPKKPQSMMPARNGLLIITPHADEPHDEKGVM